MPTVEFGRKIEKVSRSPVGPYVNFETFLARRIDNPYAFGPVKIREAIDFLHDPTKSTTPSERKEVDISQLTIFSQSDLSRKTFIDIPEGFYDWLKSDKSITLSNISERILEIMGPQGLSYANPARKYLDTVLQLGEVTDFSQKLFGVDIYTLLYEYQVQGGGRRTTMDVAGRFDEIRRQGKTDTILRIRQNYDRPGVEDAIKLAFDQIAYRAEVGAKTGVKAPKMIVFNLTDGESYELEIMFEGFYYNAVNIIILSHLAKLAGFKGDSDETSERTPEKIVTFWIKQKDRKPRRVKLTASKVYKKAKDARARLIGTSYTSPYFRFVKTKPEDGF